MSKTQPQSRAEHHAQSTPTRVRAAKSQMAAILAHRHTPQEAISSKGLADATGLKPTTVRDLVKELRPEYDLPVVSCSRGYYVIDSEDELERFAERKREEIATHEETLRETVAAFNTRNVEGL